MNSTNYCFILFPLIIIFTSIFFIPFFQHQYHFNQKNSVNNIKNQLKSTGRASHNLFIVNPSNRSSINVDVNDDEDDNNNSSYVLLIYIYANTHKYAYGNLKYFISNAVRENDGIDYYFILQQTENKPINESSMPTLPKSNAFYIQHENECFDFGTLGWFFKTYTQGNPWTNSTSITNNTNNHYLNLTRYKYFILMNSSIRGPFFPPYFLKFLLDYQLEFKKMFYWYQIFTKRLNSKVKLVGCTISCEERLHVQSYFLATDFIGLTILLKPGSHGGTHKGIFACYSKKIDVTLNCEFPITRRILEAGYDIDSLLTKYQTIDFHESKNHFCNSNYNPYKDGGLDGTTLEPYAVVFVKYNDREMTTAAQSRAELYQRWIQDTSKTNRTDW